MSAGQKEELYNNAITALRTHLKLRDESIQALDNAIDNAIDAAATATLHADLQSLLDPKLSSEEELTDITSSSSSSSEHGTSPPRHRDVITISSASPPSRRSAGGGGGAAGKRALAADSAPLQASRLRPRAVKSRVSSSSSSSSESAASPRGPGAKSRRKSHRETPPAAISKRTALRCLDCAAGGQCSSCKAEEQSAEQDQQKVPAVPPPAGSVGESPLPSHVVYTHSTCSISANGLVFQS